MGYVARTDTLELYVHECGGGASRKIVFFGKYLDKRLGEERVLSQHWRKA
jgi:hypothetical protein